MGMTFSSARAADASMSKALKSDAIKVDVIWLNRVLSGGSGGVIFLTHQRRITSLSLKLTRENMADDLGG